MKRPSFQFYPADWQGNAKLRRCSHAEKGIWIDVMCLMHDSEEYGVLRWPLADIAQAVGCKASDLRALHAKGVLKGADAESQCEPFIYIPRHARKDGAPVTLIAAQAGAVWYSSRMVVDEYKRKNAGASTRFNAESPIANPTPSLSPLRGEGEREGVGHGEEQGEDKGDGSTSTSSSTSSKYKFYGETLRLNEQDYSKLKNTYNAIPDFDAELKAADKHYTGHPEKDWFFCLDGWLNNSHQKYLDKRQPTKAKPSMKKVATL